MRKPVCLLLLMLLLGPLFVFADEITVEIIPDSYGLPLAYIYYSAGKEIARQNVSAIRPFDFDQIPKVIPDGIVKFNNADGSRTEVPRKNGKVNGIVKGYYPSGKLEYEENYIDGVVSGISREYYENGQIADDRIRQGHSDLARKVFYKNGVLKADEKESDSKHKSSKFYAEDGKLSMEQIWDDEKYVIRYYNAGKLKTDKTQIGRKVINVKEYGDNGKLISDTNY